ncbi:hypothetical protein [Microbacterium hydrothermale]|uniref:hypothetical protein n=1 Tax=Microbacterium hydrothermale TaxID=857427 RepID=UPI002227EA12|nr:hypothetical protein [Microbacterium hydrothermale]
MENNEACTGIAAFLDEFIDDAPEGHVSIDFTASPGRSATKRVAKHLARRANDRNRRHP